MRAKGEAYLDISADMETAPGDHYEHFSKAHLVDTLLETYSILNFIFVLP